MKTLTPERQAIVDRIKNEISDHLSEIRSRIQDAFQAKGEEEYQAELAKLDEQGQ